MHLGFLEYGITKVSAGFFLHLALLVWSSLALHIRRLPDLERIVRYF